MAQVFAGNQKQVKQFVEREKVVVFLGGRRCGKSSIIEAAKKMLTEKGIPFIELKPVQNPVNEGFHLFPVFSRFENAGQFRQN